MTELTNLYPETPSAGLELPPGDESKAQLETFIAEATLKYSIKDYEAAAELYSQATELQAQINGELSSRNADLLYAYGRCLYHLALRNSDVLGTKVARETRNEGSKSTAGTKQGKKSKPSELADGQTRITEEALTKVIEDNDGEDSTKEGTKTENKPFFQFTGDENFDDEDEDEEDTNGEEGDEADADDEDDFANAFEVLDLARVLLLKRIEELRTSEGEGAAKGKGKAPPDSQDMLQLKERLADTHDLQAEISLEGERFPAAVVDLRAALALKEELFAHSSSLIAEAHYKLSLALEFSSVTQQKDADGDAEVGAQAHVDEAMREEAAEEMKAAISSCKLRIKEEEATLNFSKDQNPKSKVTKADIEDVKEMVKDMEQRVNYATIPFPRPCANQKQKLQTTDLKNPSFSNFYNPPSLSTTLLAPALSTAPTPSVASSAPSSANLPPGSRPDFKTRPQTPRISRT